MIHKMDEWMTTDWWKKETDDEQVDGWNEDRVNTKGPNISINKTGQ